jgi:hypothetical protein
MKIVLDGVFNHASRGFFQFNRKRKEEEKRKTEQVHGIGEN